MTIEQARLKYRPNYIRYLLIAETPPKSNSCRFFYFEKVEKQDSLFIETMKVLYPELISRMEIKEIRKKKSFFLKKFKDDGFYLIDSLIKPFEEKKSSSRKIKLIREGQGDLLNYLQGLLEKETKVILISATVFKANYDFLSNEGIKILNTESIDFPGSGGQKKYREKLEKVLKSTNSPSNVEF